MRTIARSRQTRSTATFERTAPIDESEDVSRMLRRLEWRVFELEETLSKRSVDEEACQSDQLVQARSGLNETGEASQS